MVLRTGASPGKSCAKRRTNERYEIGVYWGPIKGKPVPAVMPGWCSVKDTDSTALPGSPGRRRRYAAWLFLGWLAFWLTTAAQPFEHRVAGNPDHYSAMSAPTSGARVSFAGYHAAPVPDDSHCPDVSAVTVDATFAATLKGDPFDADYPSSNPDVPVTQRDGERRNHKTNFPPPSASAPLYLRTQRLRL